MRKTVSVIMMFLIVLGTIGLVFNVQPVRASGTIYIRADGSIDPPTAPIYTADNITYTLTGNITANTDGIVIERDNIVVDGAGYAVTGNYSGNGITLANRSNVTASNMTMDNFVYGIYLDSSSGNVFSGNNVMANYYYGISLGSSSNYNSISGNNITESNSFGIHLDVSSNNSISGNNITNNGHGIELYWSSNNSISGNNVANEGYGIFLATSSNSSISGNHVTNNMYGIELGASSNYNSISGNNITNGEYGISLGASSNYNSISGNNITENNVDGIWVYSASNNSIFHNNFVDNNLQVESSIDSVNIWDNSYPSGGNYWSNYDGQDADHDGIGDTPYAIDVSNMDRYPLMSPWYQIRGDINGDGKVSLADLVLLANAYGSKPGDAKWNPNADINGDLKVSLADLVLLANHYGQHNP